jgi:charged multivesicular body protein 7
MKSYESSTATLRVILSHPSLQRDKIEETMDAMFSATQDAKDVDETIHSAGDMGYLSVDEDELEEELKALVQEAERQNGEAADTLKVEQQQRERDAAQDVLWQRSIVDKDVRQQVEGNEKDTGIRDELALQV